MLLTRSIRRKLLVLLVLVLSMLGGLAFASLTGLSGYKHVVKELDAAIRESPRSTDLLATFLQLVEPLSMQEKTANADEAQEQHAMDVQREKFLRALSRVDEGVESYFTAIRRLPSNPVAARQTDHLHNEISETLGRVRGAASVLGNRDRREATVGWIGQQIAKLSRLAEQVPKPTDRLLEQLQAAEADYRVHVRLVRVTSVATVCTLLLLVYLLVRWVVLPIRTLARGAKRVAEGDYETRIRMNTGDEMAVLAGTFNRMTERFQLVLAEQQNEVNTRSKQLIQSARLADVGFLAAGIAHEVNNPLAAIGMASESLEWRLGDVLEQAKEGGATDDDLDGICQYLQMIQTEAGRVRDLTQRMLDFARRSPESDVQDRNLYDLTAIVAEVLDMVGHLKRYSGRTVVFGIERPIRARVNASQIKQVILNLVTNALEAMDDGGTLRIEIAQQCEEVVVRVTDDGCGMSPETAEHIFDPFFTTKAGGSSGTSGTGDGEALADGNAAHTGTGLGLSISHRIAQDHDGSLTATSDGPGTGSIFTLRLPEAEQVCVSRAA